MDNAYDCLDDMAGAALVRESAPTPERIRTVIDGLRSTELCGNVTDDAAERLARELEQRLGVTMTIGSVLTDSGVDWTPWLNAAQAEIDPYYWNRYKKLLAAKKFSGPVISTLGRVTDRILGLLEDPKKQGPWDRRGMVVGHVQSGKTANYTGVICKAADAGYKLIVVIAGIHNNLRNQTQLRIDEGFVGRDSARLLAKKGEKFVGVGKFDKRRRPVTFTNSLRDFNKAMATGVGISIDDLNEPAVFVIKKHPHTLRNLLEWLREHSAAAATKTVSAPMLLIDDEADNASINISGGRDDVSTINGLIRELLGTFDRSCYVGYTATPFANIFIDPRTDHEMLGEDLFPKNFIVSLDPPSNYFGPNRVFLDQPKSIIRHIDDNGDVLPVKHKIHIDLTALPESLITAVRCFVVARAVRLSRGHDAEHSSMLVNASRFTLVQTQLRNLVHELVEMIECHVRVNGEKSDTEALLDTEIRALHDVWAREYSKAADWPLVKEQLLEAVAPIQVVEINSKSSGSLNYRDHATTGLSVIAVGGYSLSRGLTLEGLMISYFLRNSMMYDTLMQMGRWFGYRTDYSDLCRVWMMEEAEGWYAHIAESIEMLRDELRAMEAANATPEQFGLKVRAHPDTLIVTARSKMGSGEKVVVEIGLGNSFVETAILKCDEESLTENLAATRRLARSLSSTIEKAEKVPGGFLARGAPVDPILDFLNEFQNHAGALLTAGDPIRNYIMDRRVALDSWDVLLATTSREDAMKDSLGKPIRCQQRTAGNRSTDTTLHIGNKQRVASRGIEKTGLTKGQVRKAQNAYRIAKEREGRTFADGEKINYPDRIYRSVRDTPLLIIHLLEVFCPGTERERRHEQPVAAWSISFPDTAMEERRVSYVVNTTWLREHFADEIDEDEMAGDND